MQQQEEAEQIISYREGGQQSYTFDQDYSKADGNGCAISTDEHSIKVLEKGGFLTCQPHHRRVFLIGIAVVSLIFLIIAAAHSHYRPPMPNAEPLNTLNPPQKPLSESMVQSPLVQPSSPIKQINIPVQTDQTKQISIQVQNEKIEMQTDKDAPRPDWQTKLPKKEQVKPHPVGLQIANPAPSRPYTEHEKSENQLRTQQMQVRRNEIYQKQQTTRQELARLRAEKEQKQNILRDVLKNPYLQQVYANISQSDLIRVRKWRYIVNLNTDNPSAVTQQEKQYYEAKYQISKYEELPFCIVVPTFNNKARRRYYRNIKSILMQDYNNYKVIVIDDASTDGTGQAILSVLKGQTKMKPEQYKVIVQKERHFAMPNLRYAAQKFCQPRDIFMIVDGDDELLGKQVLKLFNAVFQKEGVWFAYSNFLGSNGKLGYSRPFHPSIIQNNQYRKYSFAVSHLRAYYTQLFLNIDLKDLQDDNGNYLTSANDMAICIPALQQAHTRIAYIPQLTYLYNFNTGLNVHKARLQEQRQNNLRIREKKSYQSLVKLFPE